jgi:hypothetical protein
MPLVEQELLTLSEHLSSPSVISGVRVTRSWVLYVCFVDRCLSFCPFSLPLCCLFFFKIRNLITPLVSQTLLKLKKSIIKHNSPWFFGITFVTTVQCTCIAATALSTNNLTVCMFQLWTCMMFVKFVTWMTPTTFNLY